MNFREAKIKISIEEKGTITYRFPGLEGNMSFPQNCTGKKIEKSTFSSPDFKIQSLQFHPNIDLVLF